MSEVFQIVPARSRGLFIIGGVVICIPSIVLLTLVVIEGTKVIKPIPVAIMVGSLLFLTVVLYVVFLSARSAQFEVSSEGLRLRGDFYGRLIPLSALELNQGRLLDLTMEKAYRPSWKTFGSSFPGYEAGWFRLKNKEKALLYLTDRRKAVYIPTKNGYSLLLSPNNPERFLEVLKRYHP